jgi:hypothetical protein
LKYLPSRTGLRVLLAAAVIPLALLGIASLPWRPDRASPPPRVVAAARGSGSLSAGAAEVPFDLPAGAPIGGFARLSYASEAPAGPVGARALVFSSPGCTVAIASAEILLVPEALEAAVRARVADLGLTGLVLAATHTHAGPGGYWDHAVGERIATGRYDPRIRDAVVAAIAAAIRRAAAELAPARAAVAGGAADDLARSRSGGAEEAPLTVVRLERLDGAPVAELTVFGAHATMLGTRNRTIAGDWPGRFLANGARGVRLFLQGALGDQSVDSPAAVSAERFAAELSGRVAALAYGAPDPSPPVAFAAVELSLPRLAPGGAPAALRPAARTLIEGTMPRSARVQAVRIGPALLLAVPGEPVARVAAEWRASLPEGAVIVSLAGGYVGYVESPERMAAASGETVRTYYGPELATRLGEGLRAAAEAALR